MTVLRITYIAVVSSRDELKHAGKNVWSTPQGNCTYEIIVRIE